MSNLNKKAFALLHQIQHNAVAGKSYNSELDYLAEFKSPFNQSHGLTLADVSKVKLNSLPDSLFANSPTFLVFQNCDSYADAFKGAILATSIDHAGEQLAFQLVQRGFREVEYDAELKTVYFSAWWSLNEKVQRGERLMELYPTNPDSESGTDVFKWNTNCFQIVESSKFPVF